MHCNDSDRPTHREEPRKGPQPLRRHNSQDPSRYRTGGIEGNGSPRPERDKTGAIIKPEYQKTTKRGKAASARRSRASSNPRPRGERFADRSIGINSRANRRMGTKSRLARITRAAKGRKQVTGR